MSDDKERNLFRDKEAADKEAAQKQSKVSPITPSGFKSNAVGPAVAKPQLVPVEFESRAKIPKTATSNETKEAENREHPVTMRKQESPVRPSENKSPTLSARNPEVSKMDSSAFRVRKIRVFDDITTASSDSEEEKRIDDLTPTSVRSDPQGHPPLRSIMKQTLSRSLSQTQLEDVPRTEDISAVAAAMASHVHSPNMAPKATPKVTLSPTGFKANVSPTPKGTVSSTPKATLSPTPKATLSPTGFKANVSREASEGTPRLTKALVVQGKSTQEPSRVRVAASNFQSRWSDGKNKSNTHVAPHRGDVQEDDEEEKTKAKRETVDHREKEMKGGIGVFMYKIWESSHKLDTRGLGMLAVTILALMLIIVQLPLSQVDFINGACMTYWGYKTNCDTRHYSTPTGLMLCTELKNRLQAGAAFSILTFVSLLVTLVCCLLYLFNDMKMLRIPMVGVLGAAFVFEMISWALIANVYSSRYCENTELPRTSAYGVGFGMSVTTWFLILINIVLGVVPL